jgi:predicted nucleic acid-binding protein
MRFMQSEKTSCFVDTNLLIYSLDPQEAEKRPVAAALLKRLVDTGTLVLSPQSLNELYRAMTERRDLLPRLEARAYVISLLRFCTAPYDFEVTRRAWQLQEQHRFGWWDTMLLASASLAKCDYFFSEDMQHERAAGGLTILNPFHLAPDSQFIR